MIYEFFVSPQNIWPWTLSGYKNQFYWQLNHAWWWGLLSIMFLCEKKERKKKSDKNLQKWQFSAYFQHFRVEENFLQNQATSHFAYYHFASLCQKSEKTNESITRTSGNKLTNEWITNRHGLIYKTTRLLGWSMRYMAYLYRGIMTLWWPWDSLR